MYNTQMLKGILEWCVLSVVNEKPMYSQEICQTLQEMGLDELCDGTLFPLMLRLEKEGYFITERKENILGPNRKYYSLSEHGKTQLNLFIKDWNDFKLTIDKILGVKYE